MKHLKNNKGAMSIELIVIVCVILFLIAFRSDTYNETMFNADSTINIRMELSFLGVDCPVTITVKCKAKYNYRF